MIALLIFVLLGLFIYIASYWRGKQELGRIIGGIFILLGLLFSSVRMIPAGHVGVTTLFGKVQEEELTEGVHLINPLKSVHLMTIRTQELYEHADVPSKEGLTVGLEVSLLYHINPTSADQIYRYIGLNYQEIVIIPMLRAAIRNVTVMHEAKALYTSEREVISGQIREELIRELEKRGIVVENVLLRKIVLPPQVQEAINNKLAAEQEAERMKFVIQKEQQEAERKRIEAQGIADFQRIVKEGIDERFLKWKALESVNELAKSPNAKFIILGDKSGLPIIVQP